MTVKLTNDTDRAEWLQCLQAAASSPWSEEDARDGVHAERLAQEADRLFQEFHNRIER